MLIILFHLFIIPYMTPEKSVAIAPEQYIAFIPLGASSLAGIL